MHAFLVHAKRLDQGRKIDARRLAPTDVAPRSRITLAARHAHRAVVEDQHGDVAAVVHHVEQPLHAHVQEGRIADHGDDLAVRLAFAAPFVQPQRNAHRGAHRDAGVERIPRRTEAQRVTTDVAGDRGVAHLRQGVIHAEVRAGGAQGRRAGKDGLWQHFGRRVRLADQTRHRRLEHLRCQFAAARQDVFAMHRQPQDAHLGLDQGLDLFDHHDLRATSDEVADLAPRQRMRETQFKHRRIRESFAHMHVRRAGNDETDPTVAAVLGLIERRSLGCSAQFVLALVHLRQPPAGVARHHHPACRVLDKPLGRMALPFTDMDQRLDVADARRQAQDDRHRKTFGQRERHQGIGIGLLRIGRFKHRHMREAPPVAGVLFVLRRGEANVVSDGDHQATDDTGQGHRHQRVGGDVHPHVLHRAEGPRTGHRRAERDFKGNFFVDRPLGIEVRVGGQGFQHLGRRRPRVGGRDANASLPHRARHRIIARHQLPAAGRCRKDCRHPPLLFNMRKPRQQRCTSHMILTQRSAAQNPILHGPGRPDRALHGSELNLFTIARSKTLFYNAKNRAN